MWKVKHVISVLMREEERAAKGEKGYLMMYEEVLLLSVTEERKNSLLELYRWKGNNLLSSRRLMGDWDRQKVDEHKKQHTQVSGRDSDVPTAAPGVCCKFSFSRRETAGGHRILSSQTGEQGRAEHMIHEYVLKRHNYRENKGRVDWNHPRVEAADQASCSECVYHPNRAGGWLDFLLMSQFISIIVWAAFKKLVPQTN